MKEYKNEILNIIENASINCGSMKDIAAQIKKSCELFYGKNWHCIVGKNFASDASYSKSLLN